MQVTYSTHNSGGSFWLKDSHWKALEKAGWKVEWGGKYFCQKHTPWRTQTGERPSYMTEDCDAPPFVQGKGGGCQGHRKYLTYAEAKAAGDKARFIGSIARHASKDFPSLKEAIEEWERVVKMDPTAEGCNCCGAPHSFSSDKEYASGSEINHYLFGDDSPKTIREANEIIQKLKEEKRKK